MNYEISFINVVDLFLPNQFGLLLSIANTSRLATQMAKWWQQIATMAKHRQLHHYRKTKIILVCLNVRLCDEDLKMST